MVDEEIIPQKKSISEDHNDEPVSLMSDLTDQVFSARKKSNNSIFEKLEHATAREVESIGLGRSRAIGR